jgi:predicted nucleic acid-binding Zn ribbon protein
LLNAHATLPGGFFFFPLDSLEHLFYNLSMPKTTHRLRSCFICHTPITQPRVGRPRVYCSDRCRQRKRRRYDYNKWIIPRRLDQNWRAAGRALKFIERHQGPFDTTPLNTTGKYTERWRVQHRLSIGMPVPWCRNCHHFYIESLPGATEQYCSSICRKADRERKRAVTTGLLLHADHLNWQVQLRAERDWPLRACDACGIPYPFDNLRKKFCSDACRARHWRQTRRKCEHCKERYEPHDRRQKYCSKRCKERATHGQPFVPLVDHRDCAFCGENFKLSYRNWHKNIYCSKRCKSRAIYRRSNPALDVHACDECGIEYQPVRNNQRFCTPACRRIASNRTLRVS